tara:strand:- start:527 stop:1285 length:759 start_codon:yes stop_codon:yes gene_type:complete
MKAIIPAAGYATRLYPLTEYQPKHLLPVVGKPIIAYVIEKIEKIEAVDQIIVVTNEKFYGHFLNWLSHFKSSKPVKVVNDGTFSADDRLGAIGDIKFVIENEKIEDDLLIILGDNIFDFELLEMYQTFVNEGKSVVSLYDVRKFKEATKYGVVELDGSSNLVGFVEKPENPKSTLCSIGVYFYPRNVLPLFDEYLNSGNSPDAPGYFLEWLYKQTEVIGFTFDKKEHDWFDIGDIACYGEANQIWESKVQNK